MAGLPETRLEELLERVARLERILVARGIATQWDMTHLPSHEGEGETE